MGADMLQEELGNIFEEQVQLRSALRLALESSQVDRESTAQAREVCAELENCLEDSGKVCAQLARERRQQISELESRARRSQSELLSMEDALEQQLDAAQLQQLDIEQFKQRARMLRFEQRVVPTTTPG